MFQIKEPTLLVDEQRVRCNIERMSRKAEAFGITLKPHVKTHQSREIGKWMRSSGIKQITVSSVKMARYFANDGWENITIAFPAHPGMASELNRLTKEISLSILISSIDAVSLLDDRLTENINAYIEIDTGSGRTGLQPSQIEDIEYIVSQIEQSENLNFRGFYSHPGHSYQYRSEEEIKKIHADAVGKMQQLTIHFESEFPQISTCIGDTPCCSVGENFEGINEISPGNFVFYDLMQVQIGSCTVEDIGVVLACPVAAVYPDRNTLVVHGGAVHLSKDYLKEEGGNHYGKIVKFDDELKWGAPVDDCRVISLSQEHGIITCSDAFIGESKPGDVIGILPVHSCLTADAMGGYLSTESKEAIDHLEGHFRR